MEGMIDWNIHVKTLSDAELFDVIDEYLIYLLSPEPKCLYEIKERFYKLQTDNKRLRDALARMVEFHPGYDWAEAALKEADDGSNNNT